MIEQELRERLGAADAEVPTPPISLWSPHDLDRRLRRRRATRLVLGVATAGLASMLWWLPASPTEGPYGEGVADTDARSPAVDRAVADLLDRRLAFIQKELRALDARAAPASQRGKEALARSRAQALLQARILDEEYGDPAAAKRHLAHAARYQNSNETK